jgi:ABC-type protease/lipase transport system fused ATPase/permease subunit
MVGPAWLRRQIGIVPQENVLFNRTARDNIALADPGMPMERVVAATDLASAHDFILELPEGYDTNRRRTRRDIIGRAAPAHRDRPGAGREPTHPDL